VINQGRFERFNLRLYELTIEIEKEEGYVFRDVDKINDPGNGLASQFGEKSKDQKSLCLVRQSD